MSLTRTLRRVALITLTALLTACAGTPTAPPQDDRLFQELGGIDGIIVIVEEFIFLMLEDPRTAHHFEETDLDRLREKLIEQFCLESGGGCRYTGDDMATVHGGLGISRAEFNITVEHLQRAMDAAGTPETAQNGLLARLAPMFEDVVGR